MKKGPVLCVHISFSFSISRLRGYNPQMMEWFGVEETFKDSLVSIPLGLGQRPLPLDQVSHVPIQPGLEHMRVGIHLLGTTDSSASPPHFPKY